MALVTPSSALTDYQTNITTSGGSGTLLTANSTADTKATSFTTVISSTDFDVYEVHIFFSDVATANTDTSILCDIGLGAASSETVVIANLLAGYAQVQSTAALGGPNYRFPLFIPSGSRISARTQAAIGSDTVEIWIWLWGKPSNPVGWVGSTVTTYGADTATSGGTVVAAGASSAEGSWTEITSATSRDHRLIVAGIDGGADATHASGAGTLDIGIGANPNEAAIAEQLPFVMTSGEAMMWSYPLVAPRSVPVSTRLSVRISHSGTAQNYGVALYGVS